MFGPEQRVRAVRVNPYFGWTTELVRPARNWQALAACSSSSQVRMHGTNGAKGAQFLLLERDLAGSSRGQRHDQAGSGSDKFGTLDEQLAELILVEGFDRGMM